MKAPIPANDRERVEALKEYNILDTEPEQNFDDITRLAAYICGTPIALITMVDRDRQWFKSKVGLAAMGSPRDHAFCAHAIMESRLMEVENAEEDARFASNPLVTLDPYIRFYAGMPLLTSRGHALGTLCVIDNKPGKLREDQSLALKALGRLVVTELELRRVSRALAKASENLQNLAGLIPICTHCKGILDDRGTWQKLEAYMKTHTDAKFAHGICPACAPKVLPTVA